MKTNGANHTRHRFRCSYLDTKNNGCSRYAIQHYTGEARCFGHWVVFGSRHYPNARLLGLLLLIVGILDAGSALSNIVNLLIPALPGGPDNPSIWSAMTSGAAGLAQILAGFCLWGERATAGRWLPMGAALWAATATLTGTLMALRINIDMPVPGSPDADLRVLFGLYLMFVGVSIGGFIVSVVSTFRQTKSAFRIAIVLLAGSLTGRSSTAAMLTFRSETPPIALLVVEIVVISLFALNSRRVLDFIKRIGSDLRV